MNILVTGGAGFIGANCAKYFADKGHHVVIFDDLSRRGSEKNLEWLKQTGSIDFVRGDVTAAGRPERHLCAERAI